VGIGWTLPDQKTTEDRNCNVQQLRMLHNVAYTHGRIAGLLEGQWEKKFRHPDIQPKFASMDDGSIRGESGSTV
jgi:hypothetical protein